MSEELQELVRRAAAAFHRRDKEGWFALCTDDFVMHSRFSSVANTTFRGKEGVEQWWDDLAEAWDPMTLEVQEVREVDRERVVLLVDLFGRGRESGIPLDEHLAQVWTFRDGLLAEVAYMDRVEAERIVRGA